MDVTDGRRGISSPPLALCLASQLSTGPLAYKLKAFSMEFCYTILSSGSSPCCGEPMGLIRATFRATQQRPYY